MGERQRYLLCGISVILFASVANVAKTEDDFYNIISFDGGGIRGLITATVVDYMESYAYTYARQAHCIPEVNNSRVPMTDLFDLLAGTSTGSLIASSLVMPNPNGTNKYFAQDVIDVFKNEGRIVFTETGVTTSSLWWGTVITGLVGAVSGYFLGLYIYTNHELEHIIHEFREYVKKRKQVVKGDLDQLGITNQLSKTLAQHVVHDLHIEHLKRNVDDGSYEQIKEAEKSIHEIDRKYHQRKSMKWITMIVTAVCFSLIAYYSIPYIKVVLNSSYDRSGIESICLNKFGDTNINEALSDEVVIVAFEYNSHTPFVFTKYNAQKAPEFYNQSIANATQSSAAAPIYFEPKVINGMVLIDGGVIANDPSLLAFLHATYNLKHPKIRVVSIGTGMAATTQLDPDTTTDITWLQQIGTLLTTTEQFAHQYTVGYLADEYYRFQANMTENLSLDAIDDADIQTLIDYGNAIVTNNTVELQEALQKVVDQKLGALYSCSVVDTAATL